LRAIAILIGDMSFVKGFFMWKSAPRCCVCDSRAQK
jgi:hypothetical protein